MTGEGITLPQNTLIAMGIKKIREMRGWTVQHFADLLGVPAGAVKMWEAGTIRPGDLHMPIIETLRNELIAFRSAKVEVQKRYLRRMAKGKNNGHGKGKA